MKLGLKQCSVPYFNPPRIINAQLFVPSCFPQMEPNRIGVFAVTIAT